MKNRIARALQHVAMAGFVFFAFFCFFPAFSLDAPPGTAGRVARVELAYRRGLANADNREEQSEVAAVRAESLHSILDTSYQAALAWLLGGNGRLAQVQREQADWHDEQDAALGAARDGDAAAPREALDLASAMTLERIERLLRLTGGDEIR